MLPPLTPQTHRAASVHLQPGRAAVFRFVEALFLVLVLSLAARAAIQIVARGAVAGGGTLTSIMSMGAIQFKATGQLVRTAAVGIVIKGRAAAAWFSGRAS